MIVIKGPIVYINPDRSQNPDRTAVLVGIASWGAACADPQYPSVSARITNALDWIQKETGNVVLFAMKRYLMNNVNNVYVYKYCSLTYAIKIRSLRTRVSTNLIEEQALHLSCCEYEATTNFTLSY